MQRFIQKYLSQYEHLPLKILDIGSQDVNGTYRPFFEKEQWAYTGADIAEGKNVDVVLKDPYNWKELKSNTYDVVVSGQALEHIEYFWITMYEIARVMKPGGLCCIIVPSSGREHRYPVDCWRYFPDGLATLARYVDLNIQEVFNDWDGPKNTEEDKEWRDVVLVCKKEPKTLTKRFTFRIKNYLSKVMIKI